MFNYILSYIHPEVTMKFPKIDMTPVSHPYPETTMFGAVAASAKRVPDAPALNFMGKYTTYKTWYSCCCTKQIISLSNKNS